MDRGSLLRFYGELDFTLRALLHYKVLSATGKPLDYFILEEFERVPQVLSKALGPHNARLVVELYLHWLEERGCTPTREEREALLKNVE